MASVSYSADPASSYGQISLIDSSLSNYTLQASNTGTSLFVRWRLICHACSGVMFVSTSARFSYNIAALESEGHPGPFEVIGEFSNGVGGIMVSYVVSVAGDRLVREGGQRKDSASCVPEVNVHDRVFVNSNQTVYVPVECNPRFGFRFVRWDYTSSVMQLYYCDFRDRSSSRTVLILMCGNEYTSRSQSLYIDCYVEWVGFVFHAYAHMMLSGLVRVKVLGLWGSREFEGHDLLLDATNVNFFFQNGPSLDWAVTAIDGIGSFVRWSDGGARSHEFTISSLEDLEKIAYFQSLLLLYGASNQLLFGSGNQLLYDGDYASGD